MRSSPSRRATKHIDKLFKRTGQLREKSRGIAQHRRIEILPDKRSVKVQAIRWQRLPVKGSLLTDPGLYCLRGNETDWDEQTMWCTYTLLTDQIY